MGVRAEVERELADVAPDWRTVLALTLAGELDSVPNASMARELRALMGQIVESRSSAGGTTLDELRRRRDGKSAASG